MNLHKIVSGAIAAVNPFVIGQLQVNWGYLTAADGKRTPELDPRILDFPMQIQPLSFRDLTQVDGLNIQGVKRKIYINGRVDALMRNNKRGGDLITIIEGPDKGVWLVVLVLEYWADWCSVAVTLQKDGV